MMSFQYTVTPISMSHGVMALNLKNAEVERLAAEVARLTGESKTKAIRRALEERRQRLKGPPTARRRTRALAFLRTQVWPTVPADQPLQAAQPQGRRRDLRHGPEGA